MNSSKLDLSIVIPAFNEESRLPKTLDSVIDYVQSRACQTEIIVVDDGSTDKTAAVVDTYRQKYSGLRCISNGGNRGKGYSVRHGMLEAQGEIALFSDADLSTPIDEADKLLAAIRERNFDGAIGSRAVNRSLIQVHQSPIREVAGIFFNRMVQWILGIQFSDTQCGFKAFRSDRARPIFEQQRIERFGFDPEILFLAKREGLRVEEIPVRWSHDAATKVNVAADGLRMFLELILIRWNAALGYYTVTRGR
ncbi:MAG TPA: dolichyl-phosphate beta-glucosyltransferase [Candidatus Saccharimonadales bacterium]|jgi:dolichyl-phosphate beta-glucosyltransferase|nr:dolichyl-phosphate beta-glucosyltransferase [Candidatus Saccharimonadales bacterium]